MTIPAFRDAILETICNILGDTDTGLTGAEIARLLNQSGIDDVAPTDTKRHRLLNALASRQHQDGCGNRVGIFIQTAMDPARYVGDPERFAGLRAGLNQALAFAGLELGSEGKLRLSTTAATLDEAQQRAGRLDTELKRRGVHHEILRFCRAELVQDNCFHAVLEAAKSVGDRIRTMTNLGSDGANLVNEAFGLPMPILAFNSLQTETEKGEHRGYLNLLIGMFGAFRNPTAHAPKISWVMTEQDALDTLTFISLLHRKLDRAVPTSPVPVPMATNRSY